MCPLKEDMALTDMTGSIGNAGSTTLSYKTYDTRKVFEDIDSRLYVLRSTST